MANKHGKLAQRLIKSGRHNECEALFNALVAAGAHECVAREWQGILDKRLNRDARRFAREDAQRQRRAELAAARERAQRARDQQPRPYTPYPGYSDGMNLIQIGTFLMAAIVSPIIKLPPMRRSSLRRGSELQTNPSHTNAGPDRPE